MVKTAQPTVLPIGGGPVTYTYAVTNTGNVPLDNVESRVTDNKCAPVTYVSGDDDLNGLLTSATDLFETGAAEVWNFQCVTTITEDTTNVVTTVGTPVRPGEEGNQLLGPDVNATATAFVQVPLPTTTVPTTTAPPTTAPPTTAPPTTAPPTTEPPPSVLPPPPPTMPGGELPTTGNSPTSTVLLSLALLAGGATLIAITRRRRVPQR